MNLNPFTTRQHPWLPALVFLFLIPALLPAQLITMSNKCYKRVEAGKTAIEAGNYQEALDLFEKVLDKCSAKDAQQEGYLGRARAYNSLGRHAEAVEAAGSALTVYENNIQALFERAVAYNALGDPASAKNDLEQVIALTEKNRNTAERATIYAKLAEVEWKQGMKQEAFQHIDQAVDADPENVSFYLLRGDMYADDGQLEAAFENYDHALEMGEAGMDMYVVRSNALIRASQEKYGTTNAAQLKAKMTDTEKDRLCRELNKAFELGLKDIQLDLLRNMLCK